MAAAAVQCPQPRSCRSWSAVRSRPTYAAEVSTVAQMLAIESALGDAARAPSTAFDGECEMSFSDTMVRMVKYLPYSPATYISAAMLVARCGVRIRSSNAVRLYVTAAAVAAKLQDEEFGGFEELACVVALPMQELVQLEAEFLRMCNFNVGIRAGHFNRFRGELNKWHQTGVIQ
eukprot:TRINITY_DN7784_c0_g1_i1.p1 TRINITY_DN7784_c0_g1~~TRINITY_DN7784_c0_g1_i1.p1  ORF type:complete len:197 (+),score=61.23 TRINITY_DN7784_c0_g1_i1:67-591(+)